MIEHDVGDDAIAAGLFPEACIGSVGNTHVEFGNDTLQTYFFKATDSLVETQTVYITDGEVTLQADTVDGDTGIFHANSKIIKCSRLGLALQLHAVVVEIELCVGVGLMGIDEGRVDVVIADGLLPDAVFLHIVALGIGAHRGLVVVEALVHHVPFAHLAFVESDDVGDMVFHDVESLLPGPVLIVGLAAVG